MGDGLKNRFFFHTGQRIPTISNWACWWFEFQFEWSIFCSFSVWTGCCEPCANELFFLEISKMFKMRSFYRKTPTVIYPSRVPMSRSKSNHSAFRGAKLTCNIERLCSSGSAQGLLKLTHRL